MLRCAHPACTFLVHVKLQLLPRLVNIGSVALLKFARRNDFLWSQLGFFSPWTRQLMIPTVQYLLHENMQRKQKLEIYQYLGAAATKRSLEVDSLTSIDLSNIVGVIVHLPSDYVYVSKSSRAKDCRDSAAD